MKILACISLLICYGQSFAQTSSTECVVTQSYTLTYQSTSGGNCTFLFTPTVTVNQSGSAVKLARYTFTAGGTTVSVCYSGNPVAIVNCNGSFSDLPSGANQQLPTATVVLPCGSGSLVLTGSKSAQGTSTCTTQSIFNGPLPVKLLSFTGISKPDGVRLNWSTESETNNEGFDLQKSRNATAFEGIGFVKGQTTSRQVSTYEFIDTDVQVDQTYYYRLKQKDIDGSVDYSRIIAVRYTLQEDINTKIFPNASADGSFMLSMKDAQSAVIRLYTVAGIEIPINTTKTGNPTIVSVSPTHLLSKGIYLLQFFGLGQTKQKSLKVIVD
ncbi:T9SS type A sorting domain-containing protein [Spirosoma sp. KCTC 42546]|uniref:T9SS type A sorting domain-containing protein n=1 Tax=Spirosoma sp. KCTC 42546 TaxID=2520506 RepID=UPI00115BC647|nr:T9SS type A sorting domain-containing protein [Spirosoma sp. KCTC 42546]QDK77658.1 T9SS type A sorting domain-containing protein [Spirosoma sp. KCTC 42546]